MTGSMVSGEGYMPCREGENPMYARIVRVVFIKKYASWLMRGSWQNGMSKRMGWSLEKNNDTSRHATPRRTVPVFTGAWELAKRCKALQSIRDIAYRYARLTCVSQPACRRERFGDSPQAFRYRTVPRNVSRGNWEAFSPLCEVQNALAALPRVLKPLVHRTAFRAL